jgi:hypothetical protein
MTCNEALLLAEFARPGATELDAAEIAALETHLAACDRCGRALRAQRAWDDRVVRAVMSVRTPAGGAARLLETLTQGRRAWWRRVTLRCIAVAAIAGGAWWAMPGPRIDVESIAESRYDRIQNADAARVWLTGCDRRFQFPPRFRPRYLLTFGLENFEGVTAPVLTFVRNGALARVVVLDERQFRNLRSLPDGAVAENSGCSVIVVRDQSAPGVVYLVEVLNGPVEPFFSEDDPTIT